MTVAAFLILGLLIGLGAGYAISSSATPTQTTTVTNTVTVTTTPQVPPYVSITGNFSTVVPLTRVTGITFTNQATGKSYGAITSGGTYSINNLPNLGTYTVTISYTPSLGSPCTAGTLFVFIQFFTPITRNWSC